MSDPIDTSLEGRLRAFHAHLDQCQRCRDQPFDMCVVGRVLLMATVKEVRPLYSTECS